MADGAPVEIEQLVPETVEGPKVPVCPLCIGAIEDAASSYKYRRLNPDTRWFYCTSCQAHVGYHRMKARWQIDPYDYDFNNRVREKLGLPPTTEKN